MLLLILLTILLLILLLLLYCSDTQSMLVSRYQEWFSRAIQEWLGLSKCKLEARITLAVQQDKVQSPLHSHSPQLVGSDLHIMRSWSREVCTGRNHFYHFHKMHSPS